MNSFLHSKLLHNLTSKIPIRNNNSILLAISCGQDSLCLLKLFIDLQHIFKIDLGVVHIDHQWRQDTTQNTEHMLHIVKKTQCPLYLYQLKPKQYSETEFRDMRYQIYINTATNYKYDVIATAHTLSDRTETCLMNLLKGSCVDQLNSLRWQRDLSPGIKLIRPLLNFTRTEINWFCKYYKLPIWFDYTNIYYSNNRNRIRHEIIPYLKQYYQIDIEKNINIFLDRSHCETEYLRQITIKIYFLIKHPNYVAFKYKSLLKQHKCIQIRVLHLFIIHNTGVQCNYDILDQILLKLNHTKELDIINNKIIIQIDKDWAYFMLNKTGLPQKTTRRKSLA
uniref:tRNA(Ile)-lysidine synthase, chloroplastic n=1 Tax=Liagora brachyclada TaxID=1884665 RepID=A0A1G4NZQ3_9FLOR|nr:tRNA Ile-lysidine synthetase [Liagora brachyclada]SCW24150.1 tRNA Ile-lysidine synthetase [Liagora brachyclada]